MTTHETYLFRDETQWKWFREEYLPGLAASKPAGGPSEPADLVGGVQHRRRGVYGGLLRRGLPGPLAMAGPHPRQPTSASGRWSRRKRACSANGRCGWCRRSYQHRFFTKTRGADTWSAGPVLTEMVAFRQHNLMEPLHERPFDLVLLKNVLIYFNEQSKTAVLHNVRAAVRPGGLLMVGMAEGVADHLRDFKRLKPWLFCKPVRTRSDTMSNDEQHRAASICSRVSKTTGRARRSISRFSSTRRRPRSTSWSRPCWRWKQTAAGKHVEQLFIAAHRMKGSAASIGLNRIAKLVASDGRPPADAGRQRPPTDGGDHRRAAVMHRWAAAERQRAGQAAQPIEDDVFRRWPKSFWPPARRSGRSARFRRVAAERQPAAVARAPECSDKPAAVPFARRITTICGGGLPP